MGIPAPTELILILLIVVLVFGGKKIPEIMGGVAQGIKTFKKALDSDDTPVTPGPTQVSQPAAPIEAKSGDADKAKIEPK
jgi:sec-independent protein translocase protein TatA